MIFVRSSRDPVTAVIAIGPAVMGQSLSHRPAVTGGAVHFFDVRVLSILLFGLKSSVRARPCAADRNGMVTYAA